jgi:hypothetical protein
MGFFDDVVDDAKDTVDDAVDKAKDVVDEAVDRGQDAVDEAQDVVDEASEGDVGGAVDEASDVGDAVTGGGSSGGSSGSRPSGASSSPTDGRDEYDDVDEFNGGGSGGSSSSDSTSSGSTGGGSRALETLKRTLKPNNNDPNDLNQTETEQALQTQRQNPILNAANPTTEDFLEARKQGLEAKNNLESVEENIRSAPENALIKTQDGETLSKNEALEQVENQQQKITRNLEQDAQRFERIQEFKRSDKQRGLSKENLIEATKGRVNLDREGKTTFERNREDNLEQELRQTRTDLGQPDLRPQPGRDFEKKSGLEQNLDVFLSDRGGELIASYIPGTDKSANQILRDEAATRRVENSRPSAFDRAQSPAGLFIGGGAGGLAFKGVTRAAATVGPRLAAGVEAAGIGLGALETGRVAGKSAKDFSQGDTTEGTERIVNFGSAGAGFVAGGRAFTRRFGPRAGTTNINQRSLVNSNNERGFGKFQADTNIVKPRVRDIVRNRNNPSVQQQVTTGNFRINGQQARGSFISRSPSGSQRQGSFEVQSVPRGRGQTPSGNRFRDTSEIVRTEENNVLFRNIEDSRSVVRSIVNQRRNSDTEEVLRSFDNVVLREDQNVRALDITTTNRQGDEFGEATTFIINNRGSGGAGSGSRSGISQTGGSSGSGGQRTAFSRDGEARFTLNEGSIRETTNINQARFRDLAQQQAQRSAESQQIGNTFGANLNINPDGSSRETREQAGQSGQETQTFDAGTRASQRLEESQIERVGETGNQGSGTDGLVISGGSGSGQDLLDDSDSRVTGPGIGSRGRTGRPESIAGNDLSQGLENRLTTGQGQRQGGRQDLGFELDQESFQISRQDQGFRQRQGQRFTQNFDFQQRFNFRNSLRQRSGFTSRTFTPTPRIGRGGLPSLQAGQNRSGQATSTQREGALTVNTNDINLDWLSSNFAEQQGETPTFNLAREETTFGGILTEEEIQAEQNQENDRNRIF